MPYQTVSSLHDDAYLTNVSVQFMNEPSRMIADRLVPMVPVQKESDKFVTFEKGSWFRNKAALIADGDAAPEGDYGTSSTTFECFDYGLRSRITERQMANSDAVMRLATNKAKFTAQHTLLERELQCATLMFATGNWSNGAVSSAWSNATSTPVNDIYGAIDYVEDATYGYRANTLVIGIAHFRELRVHPQIISALYGPGGSGPTRVTADMLADFFDVDQFLVGFGKYTTVAETATDIDKDDQTNIWGTVFGAYYVAPTPSLDIPSAAYRFQKRVVTRTYNDEARMKFWVENRELAVQAQVASDCGYLLTAI